MPDLTANVQLTGEWQNVTSAASLEAGAYSGDLVGIEANATVYQAVTDDANAPTVRIGHPWRQNPVRDDASSRRINVQSGRTLWMRVDRGECTLVITPA